MGKHMRLWVSPGVRSLVEALGADCGKRMLRQLVLGPACEESET